MVKTLALAVVLVSCGGDECEPAPDECDAATLAGWWDLGDDFGSCPPYSSRTRLDGGDRPGGQCQVIETGWGGDCRLWVEEVCDVDGGYLHTLTAVGQPVDGAVDVRVVVEMYSNDHRPICGGSADYSAVRVTVVGE